MFNIRDFTEDMVYDIKRYTIYPIRDMYRKTKNFMKWGWRLKDVHPWDYQYIYQVLYYLLDDIEKYDMKFEFADIKSRDKLLLARELAYRLGFNTEWYGNQCDMELDSLGGPPKIVEVGETETGIICDIRCRDYMEGVPDDLRKKRLKVIQKYDNMIIEDTERLGNILGKYSHHWWL